MTTSMKRNLKLENGETISDVAIDVVWPTKRDGSWFCDWTIEWPDRRRTGSAGGIDPIQSLLNALRLIGSEIYCSNEHKSGRLSWSAGWSGYGFPVPAVIKDLLVGDDAKYL